jgi:integrase/recombinase XerD
MYKEYLAPSNITDMENVAQNTRDGLLIHLLFHLGCRISEELGLTVDDIDLEE